MPLATVLQDWSAPTQIERIHLPSDIHKTSKAQRVECAEQPSEVGILLGKSRDSEGSNERKGVHVVNMENAIRACVFIGSVRSSPK